MDASNEIHEFDEVVHEIKGHGDPLLQVMKTDDKPTSALQADPRERQRDDIAVEKEEQGSLPQQEEESKKSGDPLLTAVHMHDDRVEEDKFEWMWNQIFPGVYEDF